MKANIDNAAPEDINLLPQKYIYFEENNDDNSDSEYALYVMNIGKYIDANYLIYKFFSELQTELSGITIDHKIQSLENIPDIRNYREIAEKSINGISSTELKNELGLDIKTIENYKTDLRRKYLVDIPYRKRNKHKQ